MKKPMAKKAIKVFLDSNVILSGLLSDKGAPRIILDILSLRLPFVIGITGQYNILEIKRNMLKKLPALLPVYEKYFPELNLEIVPLPSLDDLKRFFGHIADKDVPVLTSAFLGNADFLVTGDKKDFAKLKEKKGYPFPILSPSEFLDVIGSELQKKAGK